MLGVLFQTPKSQTSLVCSIDSKDDVTSFAPTTEPMTPLLCSLVRSARTDDVTISL